MIQTKTDSITYQHAVRDFRERYFYAQKGGELVPEVSMWTWYKDYLEDLAVNNDCEDNPYIQEFQDYPEKTGDSSFDNYSISVR